MPPTSPSDRLPTRSTSLWLDGTPSTTSNTLQHPSDADVVVVGAGITGAVHALLLAEAGAKVVVVDTRDGFSRGATGHSSAKVAILHGAAASEIARIAGDDTVAHRYLDANQHGLDWLAGRIADHDIECGWSRRAAVTYTTDPRKVPRLRREADLVRSVRSDVALVRPVLPFATAGGVEVAGQGQVDPVRLVHGLLDAAMAAGAVVRLGVRVHGMDRRGVLTSDGPIRCRHVVAATGLPFADRSLLFARAEPKSSYVVAVETEDPPPQDMFLSLDEPIRSLRTATLPDGETEVLLVGGDSHKTGQGGDTLAHYRALVDFADEHFGVRRVHHRFMTEDFTTPDRRPYAGPASPVDDRLLVATGFNKWGFTNAVAATLVNVAHVTDRPAPAWADDYAVTRLPLRSVPEIVSTNSNVAVHLTGGWANTLRPHPPIGPGEGRVVVRGLDRVAVSVDEEGRSCAVSGVCPHLGAILTWNPAEQTWDCPLHGSRFSRDGSLLHGPATDDLETKSVPDDERARTA